MGFRYYCVNETENKIDQHSPINKFLYWYRYDDDILACTHRKMFGFINTIGTKIKFKMELEQDNEINTSLSI